MYVTRTSVKLCCQLQPPLICAILFYFLGLRGNFTVNWQSLDMSPYQPLQPSERQIRILKLLPGEPEDSVVCLGNVVSLNDRPTYEALSYVWGNPAETRQILVNSQEFSVTVNLETALRQLRLPTEVRVLWIDAICINQKDDSEKIQQVNIMGSIYQQACHGIIWFGDVVGRGLSTSNVRAAFMVLELMAAMKKDDNSMDLTSHEPVDPRVPYVLEIMMENPWWFRIWTVQEIVLADTATIIWGTESIKWKVCEEAGAVASNAVEIRRQPFNIPSITLRKMSGQISAIRKMRTHVEISTLDLLWRFRYRYSADPRDKVLGLLGLLSSSSRLDLVGSAGYDSSVAQIYKTVTKNLIDITACLLPLIGFRNEERQTTGLPSWAIDWVHSENHQVCTSRYWDHRFRYDWFDCANRRRLDYSACEDEGNAFLSVKGCFVDSVFEVGEPSMREGQREEQLSPARVVRTIENWRTVDQVHNESGLYVGGGSSEMAFFRTLTGGLVTSDSKPSRRIEDSDYEAFTSFCSKPHTNECKCELYDTLRSMLINQAFFVTEKGYFGIGPPKLHAGDEVWALLGSNVPFILRGVQTTGTGEHRLSVGDCYVEGIMMGEAVRSESKIETVVLN